MDLFLSFLIYSFLGWLCETIYCSVGQKKFVNRGFLNGPLCPVYGFGALSVLFFLRPVSENLILLFLLGVIVTSVIEYITGYLLEKLFATKWWDYSTYRFNIHGRVCLKNSLMFGVLSVFATRCVDPVVQGMVSSLPFWMETTFSAVLAVILVSDLVVTVRTILDLNGTLKQLQQMVEQAKLDTEDYLRQNHQELQKKVEQNMLDIELGKMELREYLEERKTEHTKRLEERKKEWAAKIATEKREAAERLETRIKEVAKRNRFLRRRLISAFPNMHSTRYEKAFERVKEEILKRKGE